MFFYLLITLCTRLVEIKGELQSSRRNLKLKGSVSLSPSHSYASQTLQQTPRSTRLGEGMPLPPFSMLALFIWLVSNTANKDREKNDTSLIKWTRNNRFNVLRPQGEKSNKRHLSHFSPFLHIHFYHKLSWGEVNLRWLWPERPCLFRFGWSSKPALPAIMHYKWKLCCLLFMRSVDILHVCQGE